MANWPNIDAYLDSIGIPHGVPTWAQTEGGQHSATSLHYQGLARDYGNLDTPGGDAGCLHIFLALEQYARGPNYILQELFWPQLRCWQRGAPAPLSIDAPNHVHAGLASGKLLPIAAAPPKPKSHEEEEILA